MTGRNQRVWVRQKRRRLRRWIPQGSQPMKAAGRVGVCDVVAGAAGVDAAGAVALEDAVDAGGASAPWGQGVP